MKVLRVRPKHYPEVIDIDCSLESLQKEVEGPIQAVYPWDDEVALICNEEGKLHDDCMEKLNRTLDGPYGIPIDIVVGTFLIVGLTEDDFGELLPEFVEKYEKMFHQPRKFVISTLIIVHLKNKHMRVLEKSGALLFESLAWAVRWVRFPHDSQPGQKPDI
jgi:hypothetical protein